MGGGAEVHEQPREARKTWMRQFAYDVVWPAVRSTESRAWWNQRREGAEHERFNSWEHPSAGPFAWWDMLTEAGQTSETADWAAYTAWVQLRALGRLERGQRVPPGAPALPCTLCTAAAGRPGPPETAYHLLAQCPRTSAWVRAAVGPEPPEGVVERVLGGRVEPAAMIRLVGDIARAAAKHRRAAAEIVEKDLLAEWSELYDALGLLDDEDRRADWRAPRPTV